MSMGKSTFEFTNSSITLNGGSTTINITQDNQSYSHKLSHGYGDIATLDAGVVSFTWSPAAKDLTKFFEEIPNQTTRLIDVYLDTYNGSTLVGRDVHALTVTLSEDTGRPMYLSTPTIKDNNTVTNKMGVLLPGKSNISVSKIPIVSYGANIAKDRFTYTVGATEYEFPSISYLLSSLPLTDKPKSFPIGFKLVDSRGFIRRVTVNKTCALYNDPSIDLFEIIRCDSNGNETEAGTKAKIIVKGNWSYLNGENSATLKIGYKPQTESSYTYITVNTGNGIVDYEAILDITLETGTDYLFSYTFEDSLSSCTADGIGFVNSKNIIYVSANGEELTLGSSSDGNILIGPDHIDIRKSEDILASFSGETRTETSEFTGDPYNKNYGKISANNIIVSSGVKKDDGSTYEVAEISQYTGVDPAFTGKGSNMILKTQIGVRPQENLEEYEATIKMGAAFTGRNEIFSSITEEAEEITLKGKDIYIKPTSNFNYDIPVRLSEDCDLLTFSGKYYLGNNCTNRPVDKNGWLECKQYSTDCCHQTYTTYTGEIYKRTMKNGTWGRWTQDSGPSGVMYDLGGVKMLHGTFVTKGGGDSSKQLFTISQLKTRFGIDSASQVNSTQFMVIVQNGDGGVTGVHMQGSTWLGDKCYAVFNNIVNTQTQIRINYLIIYTPSEYFGRYSI